MADTQRAPARDGRIRIHDLAHTFRMGRVDVPVLFGIDLAVPPGEFTALCGASGSGKTTLLNLVGGLARPTRGEIRIDDQVISRMSENALCLFRRQHVGFIFQSYNLLHYLTALENVELALILGGVPPADRRDRARRMLERVGLGDRLDHRPGELSGGQQQRVSIARALVNDPRVVLADEPTGNLDSRTGREIIELLRELGAASRGTFLIVTHDPHVAGACENTVYLRDGRVVDSLEVPDADS